MKKSFVVLALAAMPLSGFAAQESYTIDPLGFSTMHGRFGKTTGKLTVDREKGTGSVNVKIDASSVNTGFDKRDDHLRSPDFLNVIEFPEITYKSTKVTIKPDKTGVVEGMVSSAESPVHMNWKNAILAAQETDTVFLNRQGPGPALRALRTEKTTRIEKEPPPNVMAEFGKATDLYFGGDMEASIALSGQVAGRIDSIKPVKQVIDETIAEFHDTIAARAKQYA